MLATINVVCSGAEWTVRCNHATWNWNRESRGTELLTLSCVGPETAVRSIRALLFDPQAKPEFTLHDGESDRTYRLVKPRRGKISIGFNAKIARMDRGAYHLVAVTKMGGIITDVSAARIWETLTGPEYSTPLVREWVPAIMEYMKNRRILEVSEGYRGSVGILELDSDSLDEIVSGLVQNGTLRLSA